MRFYIRLASVHRDLSLEINLQTNPSNEGIDGIYWLQIDVVVRVGIKSGYL